MRFRTALFIALGVVIVVAGALAWLAVSPDEQGPERLAGRHLCVDRVQVVFTNDDDMTRAAAKLRGDDRISKIYTETRSEALEQFKETFANEPRMLENARVETMAASVTAVARDGVSTDDLLQHLKTTFDGSDMRPMHRASTPGCS